MKRGKNEKVWFCLEAGWKIWYDYGKMADLGNPVKMNKTGENDMAVNLTEKRADELLEIDGIRLFTGRAGIKGQNSYQRGS